MKWYVYGAFCMALIFHNTDFPLEKKVSGVAFWPFTIVAAVIVQVREESF